MDWKLGDPVVNLYCFFFKLGLFPSIVSAFPKVIGSLYLFLQDNF